VSDKEVTINSKNINLGDILNKEAVGIDGLDLGKVIEIGDTFVVTQRGLIDKKKYYLPISSIDKFDGEFLNLKINERDLKSYEQTEGTLFEGYSAFKASDMSDKVQTAIPLIDEQLEVTKKTIEENVQIVKEPIKTIRSEEIELSYDKVTIIKRPVKADINNYDERRGAIDSIAESNLSTINTIKKVENGVNDSNKTEIIITLEREEPVITKRSFVKEEIVVKKKPIFETKTITEEVIHEQVMFNNNEISKVERHD
jgi:stress response protein YsnF